VVSQGRITSQGKLLQQDTFSVTEQENNFLSRARERRVFLFEQLVIFSEPIDKKKGFLLPGYTFKNSIKVRESAAVSCGQQLTEKNTNEIRKKPDSCHSECRYGDLLHTR